MKKKDEKVNTVLFLPNTVFNLSSHLSQEDKKYIHPFLWIMITDNKVPSLQIAKNLLLFSHQEE